MRTRGTREEVTIGVIGGDDLVHRLMAVARHAANPSWRLVASTYTAERDAARHATRLAPRVDVCLFAGPLPYDVAVGGGDLPVPATFVPVGGSSLYAALLRAQLEGSLDIERVTIDSASVDDVRSTYQEIGLDSGQVRVQPYVNPESAEGFTGFHRDHFSTGSSTGAITTVPTVASALDGAGVPNLFMRATPAQLRSALQTAALIGSGAQLEESRIVTMVARIPRGVVPEHSSHSNYWYEDLKLSLHRELLREARPMDAVVLPRGGDSYLVITTMGSLTTATDNLAVAPFLGRISADLNLDLEIGIGLGRSTREAESNAQSAVDKAALSSGRVAYLVGPNHTVLQLPAVSDAGSGQSAESPARDAKAIDALTTLDARLRQRGDTQRVVDAGTVAGLLDVTLRTARRTLQLLVDSGLAWPMPPARSSRAGRPARLYQLLVEKLP
ncbi:MAG: hypothetical protein J2P23_03700 [Microlunatus sp.]|nr:hypothetical protein [Microlunatus sp.]